MKQIQLEHIDDLALGAVFLATGGGGDPHLPRLIAQQALREFGPVDLLAPDDVADDLFVVPVGSVGAPTVSLELLPSIDEAANAVREFEKAVGRKVDAIASFEVGGGNSLVPLTAAAALGVPVIDGDGMGRAFPEAQMMSYAIAGVKPTPALAYDYAGNTALFHTDTTDVYEHHIRAYAASAGGMVTTVEHAMTGEELKRSVIPNTLSFCIELGRTLRENRGPAQSMLDPLNALFEPSIFGRCVHLFSGKIIDKTTRVVGGYDIGEATVEGFDNPDEKLALSIKNEFLLAQLDGKTLASVPDLIVVVDVESSEPINCERLRFGQRVAVFAVACPAFYRQPAALAVTEPRCFGFDQEYVPLEDLHPRR